MTDNSWNDELSEEEMSQLDALLANPDLWEEPNSADEDAIVAAILAETTQSVIAEVASPEIQGASDIQGAPEAQGAPGISEYSPTSNVVPISRAKRWAMPALSAAAGVIIALIGVAAFSSIGNQQADGTVELALLGTDLAPEAEATAMIVDLPAGTRVELDVSMLEPAPPGTYYEVWLRKDAEVGVSAGTFHLRGGDSSIELWAGVSAADYPL
ncbi:MAG: anti-sigma factor, partial [Acidimicrobiales bacterium]